LFAGRIKFNIFAHHVTELKCFDKKSDGSHLQMENDNYWLIQMSKDDNNAFSVIFRKYYRDLVLFGGSYLANKEMCEDIVQNVFLRLWDNRKDIVIETSLKSFLLKAVQNACLDELRHEKIIRTHETYTKTFGNTDDIDTVNYILYSDLHEKLMLSLEKLPGTYREVFEMNRFEGLKYKDIAKKLNVSERTVEVRIGKALALLRKYLKDFLVVFFILNC